MNVSPIYGLNRPDHYIKTHRILIKVTDEPSGKDYTVASNGLIAFANSL